MWWWHTQSRSTLRMFEPNISLPDRQVRDAVTLLHRLYIVASHPRSRFNKSGFFAIAVHYCNCSTLLQLQYTNKQSILSVCIILSPRCDVSVMYEDFLFWGYMLNCTKEKLWHNDCFIFMYCCPKDNKYSARKSYDSSYQVSIRLVLAMTWSELFFEKKTFRW